MADHALCLSLSLSLSLLCNKCVGAFRACVTDDDDDDDGDGAEDDGGDDGNNDLLPLSHLARVVYPRDRLTERNHSTHTRVRTRTRFT